MFRFAMLTLVAAVSAVGAAQAVVALDPVRGATALAAVWREGAPPPQVQDRAAILKSADGHYWAEGEIQGRPVRFLVDTGATTVALTQEDARRLGYDTEALVYGQKVLTAAGEARAAVVKLPAVSIAGASVSDVDAMIVEKGLETSLLGMSYLGRLSGFEATRTSLVLQP
ncbi:TIGR02281 family clan AA aspartic protease [Phenylobacterium sp.]|uniref:TIGR02281 family clan AA aspartic protease n=1 Tax=Phenylobacterium sp. TaxID=1871053 RepID=UPI0017D6017A|nr:TIGR02281 family clan AA aspartic protease [Phenylobacterium sp.]MBA4794941.1 TIGR02281 family clan AA aspartic protease [Phenylobacterium sp.]MBC7168941.1 TIGR02281 family clan AA aspartic protease [Phenylobacterium sp.]